MIFAIDQQCLPKLFRLGSITTSKCFLIYILFQLMLILAIDQQNSWGHDQLLSSVHVIVLLWNAVQCGGTVCSIHNIAYWRDSTISCPARLPLPHKGECQCVYTHVITYCIRVHLHCLSTKLGVYMKRIHARLWAGKFWI